jgi:hypothetical protein
MHFLLGGESSNELRDRNIKFLQWLIDCAKSVLSSVMPDMFQDFLDSYSPILWTTVVPNAFTLVTLHFLRLAHVID